jgi:hypothetical protein
MYFHYVVMSFISVIPSQKPCLLSTSDLDPGEGKIGYRVGTNVLQC